MSSGEYGKIYKRIWGDKDFKALPGSQQLLYVKLLSQPDISMAGVLTLASVRWAGQTADATHESIAADLYGLQQARFLAIDYGTQEVLLRSYIRNDLGWKSPKTMKAIAGAVERILSPALRCVISGELQRIDVSELSTRVSDTYGRSTRDCIAEAIARLVSVNPPEGVLDGVYEGENPLLNTPSDGVSDTPCDTPCDTPSDRGYASRNAQVHATAPANALAPAPAPAPAPAVETLAQPLAQTGATAATAELGAAELRNPYPPDFETFWSLYPIRRGKGKALKAWQRAIKRADKETINSGATRYRDDPNREDQYTKYAEGWLNADGWNDEPLPPRNNGRQTNGLTDTQWQQAFDRAVADDRAAGRIA